MQEFTKKMMLEKPHQPSDMILNFFHLILIFLTHRNTFCKKEHGIDPINGS